MASEPCWIWAGFLDKDGYGMLAVNIEGKKTSLRAHRLMYEAVVGKIEEGLTLDHLCDTPSCINPDHLEPATIRQNVLRSKRTKAGINARKTHCINGHAFNIKNTHLRPTGGRTCRECHRLTERRRRGIRNNK